MTILMKVKAGLFGIGLHTYWPQFEGLLPRLEEYQRQVQERIASCGVQVADAGMVDSPAKSQEAASFFLQEKVEVLFVFISTYALSHTVLPVVQKVKVPVIILNLQPERKINYEYLNAMKDRGKMTGEWLAYCQSCVAPELSSVFNRAGIAYKLVTGFLDDGLVWQEVSDYCEAIRVKQEMANSRIGLLGHYYNGMLDVYSDLTQQASAFGCHFEILEMGSLRRFRDQVSSEQVNGKLEDFQATFLVSEDCSEHEMQRAARTSVALEKLVEHNSLHALAYYYEAEGDESYLDIVTSLIPGLTLLTGRNVPVAGEYEVKNVLAMKMLDLMGCGGSFSEFYAMDFDDNVVLLGHDGPAHFAIAEGKVELVPLPVYHGKPGKGLSIQMKVKTGPVTLLSVCQGEDGKVFLLVAQGHSEDGPTLQIGNTNSRYRFSIGIRQFMNDWCAAGPSHHCAIGVGHKAGVLHKLADFLNIKCVQVC